MQAAYNPNNEHNSTHARNKSSYPADHNDHAYQKSRPSIPRLRYIDVEAHSASGKAVHKAETSAGL
jgi:hypothetical protein